MKIVLISGKAEAAKTTFANQLQNVLENKGYTVSREMFAKGVKEMAKECGWNGKKDKAGRDLLQYIGEGARNFDKKFWVNQTLMKYCLFDSLADYVLVDDWRYESEFYDTKKLFGEDVIPIRIVRPYHVSSLTLEQQNHPSETGLDKFKNYDAVIINDATIFDLYKDAEMLYKLDFKIEE